MNEFHHIFQKWNMFVEEKSHWIKDVDLEGSAHKVMSVERNSVALQVLPLILYLTSHTIEDGYQKYPGG